MIRAEPGQRDDAAGRLEDGPENAAAVAAAAGRRQGELHHL